MGDARRRGLGLAIVGLLAACSQGVGTDGPGQNPTEGGTDPMDSSTGSGPMPATDGETSTAGSNGVDDGSGAAASSDTSTGSDCGNGQVDGDELCDDGNDIQSDGCNVDCVPSGSIVWSHTLASGLAAVDAFRGLALVDGDAWVVGSVATPANGRDVVLRRYGSAGSLELDATFDAGASVDEEGYAIASDGEAIYIAGTTNVAAAADGLLAQLDFDGNVAWLISVDGGLASSDELRSVAVGPDGQPVVGGYSTVVETMVEGVNVYGLDGKIAKYDASGSPVWTASHAGVAGSNDVVEAVAVDGSGNVIAAGWETATAGGINVWVGKYDPAGTPVWSRTYDGTEALSDYGRGVAVGTDGSIVVVASEGSSTIEELWWVRCYDAAGTVLWTDVDAGSTGEGMRARAVTISTQGTVSVTGEERVAGARRIAIRKYAGDGTPLWTTVVPSAVATDPSGRAIVSDAGDALYVAGAFDKGVDALDGWIARAAP